MEVFDRDHARDLFIAGWNAQMAEVPHGANLRTGGRKSRDWPNGEDERWWAQNGPDMVARWMKFRRESGMSIWTTPDGRPGIELSISEYLPGGVRVRAIIDRVMVDPNGELGVVDIKTGSRPPASPMQLAFYAAAIETAFGVRPTWGGYWMARTGDIPERVGLDRYPTEMVARWARDYQRAARLGIYVPKPSSFCSSCGVREHCYMWGYDTEARQWDDDLIVTSHLQGETNPTTQEGS